MVKHVLSCSVKTCNTRSEAAHLWKKVTGSISWRNYFKTKNVWTFLALSCSLFLEKRLEMLSDEIIEKCNSLLVCLFIFCFLNIIIRPFFRDVNFTLKKGLFYYNKTMHLVICTIYEAPARSINTTITTLGVCLYNVLEVCQVWLYYSCIAVTQRLMCDVIVSSAACSPSYF